MNEETFEKWHAELTTLAKERGFDQVMPSVEDYPRDGYNDGNTPAEELNEHFFSSGN